MFKRLLCALRPRIRVLSSHGKTRMKQKRYGCYQPNLVYQQNYYQLTLEDAIRQNEQMLREWEIRHQNLRCAYKTKTTQASRMLEVQVYPSFLDRKDYTRALKEQRTGEAQKRHNDEMARQKFVRTVHSNFHEGDIFFTGDYSTENQPGSLEECHKDLKRMLECLRYHTRKAGAGKIKYIYVIEQKTRKDGATDYHVHILLSRNAGANRKGIDARDWIESKWKGGGYANTKSLQWKEGGGFTGISTYFTKQFEELHDAERPGLRRWGQSLGLKQWTKKPSESYSRFKKRRVAGMIRQPATMMGEFEKEYPGYKYLEDYPCQIRYSPVIDGFYLYCRMYKRE